MSVNRIRKIFRQEYNSSQVSLFKFERNTKSENFKSLM